MSQIQKTLDAIAELRNQIVLLADSGEIPENETIYFDPLISELNQLDDELKEIQSKPTKKKNLITGEFSLKGRADISPGQVIKMEMFGKPMQLLIESLEDDLKMFLFNKIEDDEDLLFFETMYNVHTDQLNFSFAFQVSDNFMHEVNKGKDIAILTPGRKLVCGYTYLNRVYFSNDNIKNLPDELWNYPCFSFKVPYSIKNDPIDLLNRIRIATQGSHGGFTADLRFWSETFRGLVDPFVSELKNNRWKIILTQWERFYLNPDGNTYRTIKMK